MTGKDIERKELIDKRIKRNMKKMTKLFKKRLKRSKVKRYSGWEDFIINRKSGKVFIRCQRMGDSTTREQCLLKARHGLLVCQYHDATSNSKTLARHNKIREYLGIYDSSLKDSLKKEMEEIKKMPKKQIESVGDEVRLAIVTVRNYLNNAKEKEIAKNPGKLLWMMKNIVEFKEIHHSMTHAPKVVFTREQIEFIFIRLKMMLIDTIKDAELLRTISDKMRLIGSEVKVEGTHEVMKR
jgi:hypothetical protein